MPTMAASTGQSFIPLAMRRRAPADDEHRFADTGVHGIDGDEVSAVEFSRRIHCPGQHQLLAVEPRVLARGDNGPDDLSRGA